MKPRIPEGPARRVFLTDVFQVTVIDGGGMGETLLATTLDEGLAETLKSTPSYGGHGRVRRRHALLLEMEDGTFYDVSKAEPLVLLTEDPADARARALAKLTGAERQLLGLE